MQNTKNKLNPSSMQLETFGVLIVVNLIISVFYIVCCSKLNNTCKCAGSQLLTRRGTSVGDNVWSLIARCSSWCSFAVNANVQVCSFRKKPAFQDVVALCTLSLNTCCSINKVHSTYKQQKNHLAGAACVMKLGWLVAAIVSRLQ